MFVPQPDGIVGGHVKFVVQALWSLILMVGGLPAVGDVSRSLTQGSRSLIIEISGRVRAEAGRSWAQCTVELLSFTYNKETHTMRNTLRPHSPTNNVVLIRPRCDTHGMTHVHML